MTNGLLIYMVKYLRITSHIRSPSSYMTLHRVLLHFLIYDEKYFCFYQCAMYHSRQCHVFIHCTCSDNNLTLKSLQPRRMSPKLLTLILRRKAEIDLRDLVSKGNLSFLTCAFHCTKEDKAEVDNSTINMSLGQQRGLYFRRCPRIQRPNSKSLTGGTKSTLA
jgi:hypothetical protein